MSTDDDARIGERRHVAGVPVDWRVDSRPKRRGQRRTPPQEGRVVDLSVTGAAVEAPADADLRPGMRLVIEAGGHRAVVAVRHIQPTDDPEVHRYGVEFLRSEPELMRRFYHHLASARPASIERRWMEAR